MRERFRSFDSKISFFAFADIITAVSGMIIFITLLLATDLGRPSEGRSRVPDSEVERRLQETLSKQAEVDAQNQSLQGVLAAAETAPPVEKLESDIERLRGQLTEEKKKHASLAEQLAAAQSASDSRDRTLGLIDLKNQIQQIVREAEAIALQTARVRDEMAGVEQHVASVQSKLLKLRERQGNLWLIPDKSSTTKEPILAVISGSGAKVERFDHPEQARQFNKSSASAGFDSYLGELKPLDQYVVFQVRPSGIELFERLVKIAREKGFEVGFDAIEEQGEIHFATPPPLDEPPVQTKPQDTETNAGPSASSPAGQAQTNVTPTATAATKQVSPTSAASPSEPTRKTKSWWQRFLELIGLG
jgi:hypothetical protein